MAVKLTLSANCQCRSDKLVPFGTVKYLLDILLQIELIGNVFFIIKIYAIQGSMHRAIEFNIENFIVFILYYTIMIELLYIHSLLIQIYFYHCF